MTHILLPGLDGTGELFKPLLAHLKGTAVKIISYPPDQCLDYDELEQYVRKRLPRKQNFIIVAESFSGPIACQIALKPPANLKKVIFLATFLDNPRPFLLTMFSLMPLALILRIPMPRFLIKTWISGKDETGTVTAQFEKSFRTPDPPVAAFRLRQIAKLKRPAEKTGLPIVYVQAGEDKLIPRRAVRPFQSFSESAEVIRVAGPHLISQAKPEECARIILNGRKKPEKSGKAPRFSKA